MDNTLVGEEFVPWQPSTWPQAPAEWDPSFVFVLERIFRESMLDEVQNVIKDAPTLQNRGHIVALAVLSSIDTLSSYAFQNLEEVKCELCGRGDRIRPKYINFLSTFFPEDYRPFAESIYTLYRNPVTHSWNLFQVGLLPDSRPISNNNGTIEVGLLNFVAALNSSVRLFLEELKSNIEMQKSVLFRYETLRASTRA